MRLNLKKALLTGSAVVAVGAFASQANAAALVLAPATVTNTASAADTIAADTQAGSATSTLTYAFVGNTNVTLTSAAGGGTTNLGAITIGANTANTNTLTIGDHLKAVNLVVNGDISGDITGTVNDLNINLDSNAAAAVNANLNAKGNINLGSGVITLDSAAASTASLTLSGTAAQTVTGIINGAQAGDGVITVTNTGGTVTFASNVGATAVGHIGTGTATGTTTTVFAGTVGVSNASTSLGGDGIIALGTADGGSTNTTFKGAVTTTGGITLGVVGAGVDTNTVTFDATGGSYAVAGAIGGLAAADNDSIVVSGGTGKVVTFSNNVSGNLDSIAIAAATGMSAAGDVAATAITLGAGSTLTTTGAGKNITGAVTGAGTLAVTGTTTLIGSATGLTAVTVANAGSLTVDATAANRALSASAITLTGSGALNFTPATFATTVTGPIGAAVTGNGTLTIADGAGSVSFANSIGTSTLKVGTLTITDGAGANVVNASGDLQVNTIVVGQNDTVNLLATTGTVSGTVDGAGAGKGSIVVGNGTAASNYTFGSAVGTTTATVAGFKVSAASTANISKSVATTASGAGVIGFDNEGTLNVDSTANAVTIGTLVGTTKLNGTTSFTGSGAFSNTVNGAAGLNIDGTLSTAVLNAGQTLTLASTGNVLNIGANSNTTINAGNQIILTSTVDTIGAAARSTTININKTATFDPTAQAVIVATAGVVNNATTTGTLTIGINSGSVALANGATITVIDSSTNAQLAGVATTYAAQIAAGRIVLQNTGLISLVDNTSDAQDLKVKVVYKDAATVLATQANASVATSLMANTTATGNLNTARNNLLSASTAASANLIAESLSPAADGAAADVAFDVTDRVFDLAATRLASIRDGSAETGMAAGNGAYGHRVWAEGFGRTATQDRRNGTAGYDADTGGVAVGVDGITDANQLLGVAVSYANTNVDSKNANTTATDIDSYQVSIYGQMPVIDSNTFITGMAAYGFNKNDSTRHNVGGIAGVTAKGSFDASQYSAQVDLGRDYKNLGNGLTLTPSVGAHYAYYDADSYTETGAGTANLNVNQDSLSSLDLGVGVDAKWDIANKDGSKLVPSLNAAYRYDVIGDSLDSTSSFTGGGAAFNTKGVDPARSTFTAGAGLKYVTTTNWELSARYTFDAKSDYTAHAGQVRAGYKF